MSQETKNFYMALSKDRFETRFNTNWDQSTFWLDTRLGWILWIFLCYYRKIGKQQKSFGSPSRDGKPKKKKH